MAECITSYDDIKKGIIDEAMKMALESNLFDKIDETSFRLTGTTEKITSKAVITNDDRIPEYSDNEFKGAQVALKPEIYDSETDRINELLDLFIPKISKAIQLGAVEFTLIRPAYAPTHNLEDIGDKALENRKEQRDLLLNDITTFLKSKGFETDKEGYSFVKGKSENADYQSIIENINSKFSSPVISEEADGSFTVAPTDRLITEYVNANNPTDINKDIPEETSPDVLYNLKSTYDVPSLQNLTLSVLSKETSDAADRNIVSQNNGKYYITSTPKDGTVLTYEEREKLLEYNKKRFNTQLDFYSIPKNVFEFKDFETGTNRHGIEIIKRDIKNPDELQVTTKAERIGAITSFLAERMNYAPDNIISIDREDFAKRFPNQYEAGMTGVNIGDKFYLFRNETTDQITGEELLHPFINAVFQTNKPLFDSLLQEAHKDFPILTANTKELYRNKGEESIVKEIVTKALSLHFNEEHEKNPPSLTFRETVQKFLTWMNEAFQKLFGYYDYSKMVGKGKGVVSTDELPQNLSYDDLAKLINTTDSQFETAFEEKPYFALAAEDENLDKEQQRRVFDMFNDTYDTIKGKEKIEKIFPEFDQGFKNLQRAYYLLKNTKGGDTEGADVIGKLIKRIQTSPNDGERVKSYLSGIATVAGIMEKLTSKAEYIDQNKNYNISQKIIGYNDISTLAQSMDPFIESVKHLHAAIKGEVGNAVRVVPFLGRLNAILSVTSDVAQATQRLIKDPLIETAVNELSYRMGPELIRMNKEIVMLEAKKQDFLAKKDLRNAAIQSKLIDKRMKERLELPVKEHFERIFAGQERDANWYSLYLESMGNNGHIVVQAVANIIQSAVDQNNADFVHSENEVQRFSDGLRKQFSLTTVRNPETFLARARDDVQRVTGAARDKDGKIVHTYVTMNSLLSPYRLGNVTKDGNTLPGYITQHEEFISKIDFINKERREAVAEKNDEKIQKADDNLDDVHLEFHKWIRENAELQFKPEVHEMWDKMDEELGRDVNNRPISLRSVKDKIFDKIEQIEFRINDYTQSSEEREQEIDTKRGYQKDLRQLANRKNEDGSAKEGVDLKIAEASIEYSKLRVKYGDYVLTPEGEERFNFDVWDAKDKLEKALGLAGNDKRAIAAAQNSYNYRMARVTKANTSPDYFKAMADVNTQIAPIEEKILANKELSASFSPEDRANLKDITAQMGEETKPYKDDNGVIDGQFLSKDNPDLVKRIKTLQEKAEQARRTMMKIDNLSMAETIELNKLRQNTNRTPEEEQRYSQLQTEYLRKRALGKDNEKLLSEYRDLITYRADLTSFDPTEYYIDEKELQTNILKKIGATQDVVNAQLLNGSVDIKDNGHFDKLDGIWYKKVGNTYFPNAIDEGVIRDYLERDIAEDGLTSTDWWKDNHYSRLQYNTDAQDYIETDTPLFIWTKMTPKNKNWIVKDMPSNDYYRYKVKDGTDGGEDYTNKNYETIGYGVPKPKEGKYVNERYKQLSESGDSKDKAYFDYLKASTAFFKKHQEGLPEFQQHGYILPSMIKTKTENTVRLTNEFLTNPWQAQKDLRLRAFQFSIQDSSQSAVAGENKDEATTADDQEFLINGSQRNTRKVPFRFSSKMDKSVQSGDIGAMLLAYAYETGKYKQLKEQAPIIESFQRAAKTIGTKEQRSVSTYIPNVIKRVFSMKSEARDTNVQSILSKTIDSIVNRFVYGQRSKEQYLYVNGKRYDLNKLTSSSLSFTSKAIFMGGLLSGVKNSIAARFAVLIQSNKREGIYGDSNIAHAHAQLPLWIANAGRDYFKAGNKTITGQLSDYFSVVPEDIRHHATEKITYNLGEDKLSILMGSKVFSEYEAIVMQFLTVADAWQVNVGGKMVPLIQAFELVDKNGNSVEKNGDLQLKKDAVFTSKDRDNFLGLFRKATGEQTGRYRQLEQTEIETQWAGKMLMYMGKFWTPGITKRYGGLRYSNEYGKITEGVYRASVASLFDLFKTYHFNLTNWKSDLTLRQKSALVMTARELTSTIALMMVISAVGGGSAFGSGTNPEDQKKIKENSWLANFLIASAIATQNEVENFIPLPGMGVTDAIRKAQNPFLVMQTVKNLAKAVQYTGYTIINDKSAYYTDHTLLHDKGDSKAAAFFLKVMGISKKTLHPSELIKTAQQTSMLR